MNELALNSGKLLESVVIGGDLSGLSAEDRVCYYTKVCESLGLNPLTKPFEYMKLQGKMTLYARKDCTEQLRNLHGISIEIRARELVEDCYIVTARATSNGRCDEAIGAVSIQGLKGEARANALMKAETKAKRRVTLSIAGLGMLDEHEVETIPGVKIGEPEPVISEDTLNILKDYIKAHEISHEKLVAMLQKAGVVKLVQLSEKTAQKWIARFQELEEELLKNQAQLQMSEDQDG